MLVLVLVLVPSPSLLLLLPSSTALGRMSRSWEWAWTQWIDIALPSSAANDACEKNSGTWDPSQSDAARPRFPLSRPISPTAGGHGRNPCGCVRYERRSRRSGARACGGEGGLGDWSAPAEEAAAALPPEEDEEEEDEEEDCPNDDEDAGSALPAHHGWTPYEGMRRSERV